MDTLCLSFKRRCRDDTTLSCALLAADRGQGKSLRPSETTRRRGMTLGLYFNGLIEGGQVERFDTGLKRVHDVGSEEISLRM